MFKFMVAPLVAFFVLVAGFGAITASAANDPAPVITEQGHERLINCAYDNATFTYLKVYGGLPLPADRFVDSSVYHAGLPAGYTYFASAELGSACPSNAYAVYQPGPTGPIGPF